jgi:hypothetical protein
MTRINWDEVHHIHRLDELIAYCIITLQEAYTAADNDDVDSVTKNEIADWVRWEIAYDDSGRAFFRYAASLYVKDTTPMARRDFLELINSPTKYLVRHTSLDIDYRSGDTSLKIDTRNHIPARADTLEKVLFWAIVLGDWWNLTLKYIAATDNPTTTQSTPIDAWGDYEVSYGDTGSDSSSGSDTIDAQFDEYNGTTEDPSIPSFLTEILDTPSTGSGSVNQTIDLPSSDSGSYRENLTTCEEQDPAIKNYSQQQLDALLPTK